ncbi:branched-chain amino acid ABC transporter permease [Bradyrhizobium sp. dw_78]|uniref:branched-chain amino acid ABC transporter permease n=1 Tax=Bradyrhizobium sp. dw_78 TaxID=2719793 RepID=UPI001BD2D178|nr:branched-chain amino acid ABC transporter permease [Bradyrhizobium sp. dw_78]
MVQILFSTVALASAYALMSLGFVLVLNATQAVNFGHGAIVTLGSYISFTLGSILGSNGLLLLPVVILLSAPIGLVLYLVAYLPLQKQPVVTIFISTISVGTIIENLTLLIYGPEPKSSPPILGTSILHVGSQAFSEQSLAVIVTAAVLIAIQYVLFTHTRIGKRLRAVAQDPFMAAACGIDVRVMVASTFMIATALAGAAGAFLGATYYTSPTDGANYTIKAYLAATIGGWGSLPGAVLGAFLVAIFEILIPALPALFPAIDRVLPGSDGIFTMTSSTVVLFAVFILVLLFRPQGLLGEAVGKRA